ncbi:MAG: hypothetical protein H0X49_01440 [Acidobacteria bacterium]|jgi:hypothetical protein|nr:hypothetical protein [Acidobacteriota bacterium]
MRYLTLLGNYMKNFTALLLCILLLPVWATAQKGFVKEKLGDELDDLMTGFSEEGYSGAVLVAQKGDDENTVAIFTVNNDLNFRRVVAPTIVQTIWKK